MATLIISTPSPLPVAKEFARIHAACFTIPRPWTVEEFVILLKKRKVFYITHEHGFVLGQFLDGQQIELLTFAIIPEQQGKGIGHGLLDGFIEDVIARNGKSILLEVAENNATALYLYRKFGFKEVSVRPAYYEVPNTPNIDAITMRLDITNVPIRTLH